MNDLTEFQQRAVAVATLKMLSGKHFSVCDLDAIAKTMGMQDRLAGRDYAALRSLHCIDWADMGPELALQTRAKCLELLGLPAAVIDKVCEVVPPASPAPQRSAGLLGLPFWRRV